MPISKLNVQRQEASQVQKLRGGPGSAADDDAISFPEACEAFSIDTGSVISSEVTSISGVAQTIRLITAYRRWRR